MPLDHLWATWRSVYLGSVSDSRLAPTAQEAAGRSLFERILEAPGTDDDKHVVHRGERCFVLLNKFPYTVGHLMVLPNHAVAEIEDLDAGTHEELWAFVRSAVVALKLAFVPDGVNVGVNLGAAAGGSQSDHLHVHCVPRWVGDTNFIASVGETRVLPMSLDEACSRLRAVWPQGAVAAVD